jgi:hypothetical protein
VWATLSKNPYSGPFKNFVTEVLELGWGTENQRFPISIFPGSGMNFEVDFRAESASSMLP